MLFSVNNEFISFFLFLHPESFMYICIVMPN